MRVAGLCWSELTGSLAVPGNEVNRERDRVHEFDERGRNVRLIRRDGVLLAVAHPGVGPLELNRAVDVDTLESGPDRIGVRVDHLPLELPVRAGFVFLEQILCLLLVLERAGQRG